MNDEGFVLVEKPFESTIKQYKEKIPRQVLEIWENDGFGSFKNGYLRIVNPDRYREVLENTYVRHNLAIPLFTTAMGDILVWEDNYLMALNFRKNEVNVVAGNFEFFLGDLNDEYYLKKALAWEPYIEAVKRYGEPAFDECFGYTPLLGLGGPEKVENLKKVKLIEHIYLTTEFMGPIK